MNIPLLPTNERPLQHTPPHLTCTLCTLHSGARSVGIGLHTHHSGQHFDRPALLIVGQNPGYHEDIHSTPFVGKTGYVLHNSYIAGLSLQDLTSIYFANTARCYSDSDPKPAHYKACIRHTLADIRTIAPLHPPPLYILTLGAPATTHTWSQFSHSVSLTESFAKQGTPARIDSHSVLLFSTFHPAAVLRTLNLIHAVSGHLQILADHLTGNAPIPTTPSFIPARSPCTSKIHPPQTPQLSSPSASSRSTSVDPTD